MRLSNGCVLFLIFFCMALILPDLRERYFRQVLFTTEMYHRNVDRATEDALFGTVKEEHADGSIRLDVSQIQETFYEQIYQQFEVSTADEKLYLEKSVLLEELVNNASALSIEEKYGLQEKMETIINESSAMSELEYGLNFPLEEEHDSSQPLSNQALYHFVEFADEKNYPWSRLLTEDAVRFFFSGAKLLKSRTP